MLRLECAAAAWYDGLSSAEQQAYVKAHPGSKYGKGDHGDVPTHELRAKHDALKAELVDHHTHNSAAPMKFNKRYPELESMQKALKER
jgi:hypothetical protein